MPATRFRVREREKEKRGDAKKNANWRSTGDLLAKFASPQRSGARAAAAERAGSNPPNGSFPHTVIIIIIITITIIIITINITTTKKEKKKKKLLEKSKLF
jgi:hypothetical protein